jgi:hypothetical protein
MKKLLTLRAIQTLKGNDAVTAEILKALRKTKGNMRAACTLLGLGKSSMYRLIADVDAAAAVDELIRTLGVRVNGKVLSTPEPEPQRGPRLRVKRAATA